MCEAWEEILMQMDSRLTKFVQVMYLKTLLHGEELTYFMGYVRKTSLICKRLRSRFLLNALV